MRVYPCHMLFRSLNRACVNRNLLNQFFTRTLMDKRLIIPVIRNKSRMIREENVVNRFFFSTPFSLILIKYNYSSKNIKGEIELDSDL